MIGKLLGGRGPPGGEPPLRGEVGDDLLARVVEDTCDALVPLGWHG